MIKIFFLEGYAGLRLQNNEPIEFKKGINLIIGKNGSGKSNLAWLLKFIFNTNNQPNKRLFETPIVDEIIKQTVENYENRRNGDSPQNAYFFNKIIPSDFNAVPFCKFLFEEAPGNISFNYNGELELEDFLKNMKEIRFSSGLISIAPSRYLQTVDIEAKIQLDNNDIRINEGLTLFDKVHDSPNPIVNSIVSSFNTFFEKRLKQFVKKDPELLKELEDLKNAIIIQYNNFFDQTNKRIQITLDPKLFNGRALVLTEGDNVIEFESLSDGEKNLFNLIINLATARTNKPVLIYFDEPELFMHDDMIRTMIKEIYALSHDLPDACIVISTHSSVLIETLAEIEKEKLNLITITDKQISNSNEDVEFINVLHNNGVKFSPLYLSKRPNLFIENSPQTGQVHQKFYSDFFSVVKSPNIIPIGSSGQVKTYKQYASIIEQIVKTQPGSKTFGILDGDMFVVTELKLYLNEESQLSIIINKLKSFIKFYIYPSNFQDKKTCYFNCWEIENLYLLKDIIPYWKDNANHPLTHTKYLSIIKLNKERIINSWYKTYKRSIIKPLYFDNESSETLKSTFEKMIDPLIKLEENNDKIRQKLDDFFEGIISEDLLNWLPGKEVYNELKTNYSLDTTLIPFDSLPITPQIRAIIELQS
ncbi:ATP-binding protein [Mucilaginibacter sp.]|uniref:ATP-binding protein n=1 Tax=Mucilaginibacter sp. TaxID=1882438 RepID=UPI0026043C49|nr:ATP-binding protein [Mucilaginibacter sp.]MDB4921237.1 ATPase protein [Mucilaginibacter sp.]